MTCPTACFLFVGGMWFMVLLTTIVSYNSPRCHRLKQNLKEWNYFALSGDGLPLPRNKFESFVGDLYTERFPGQECKAEISEDRQSIFVNCAHKPWAPTAVIPISDRVLLLLAATDWVNNDCRQYLAMESVHDI